MTITLRRWGKGLAVRIPPEVAEAGGLADGSQVELTIEPGRVILCPLGKPRPNLLELVARITEDNLHGETDWGPPVGREVLEDY